MLHSHLYYSVKPLVPRAVRFAARRWLVLRKLRKANGTWPILPGSERPPEGWPGWPEGKRFAFVLTHDVESQAGLEKCQRLMELERKWGFHSSFNFIPEGAYQLPRALREEVAQNGFEVGIHDLHHDGKLYRRREGFERNAARINQYLADWGAVGFRSGFMLHNLDWLHSLNVVYDASTFDTDPFEPQPDGVGTIFPFWVPFPHARQTEEAVREKVTEGTGSAAGSSQFECWRFGSDVDCPAAEDELLKTPPGSPGLYEDGPGSQPVGVSTSHHPRQRILTSSLCSVVGGQIAGQPAPGPGYVELPYTLPQDSTLFLFLQERSPKLWMRKLDWIAKHGGMALVNVHPDYIRFPGERPSQRTFPVEYYERLLAHCRQHHGQAYWQPLPKEMAAFAAEVRPPLRHKPRRVCMLTHSHYLADARVMRYAEALADRGDQVDVVALHQSKDLRLQETSRHNVNLVRIQPRFRQSSRAGSLSYLLPILRFLFVSSLWITRRHARQQYDLLHIHNVPDFLVFAAVFPKLRGAKVILDIHDIVPEFFASKFERPENSLIVRMLKWVERMSARFADHIIIANHLWLERYVTRTGASGKCSVFINNVDARLFHPRPRVRNDGRFIILFPGGLQHHQGLDIAIRGFKKISADLPNAEFHIYGSGNMKQNLVALCEELKLDGKVRFFDEVPLRQIVEVMANADLSVVPKRADSFGNEAYSTKIMEFMSLGVPVVASNTKIDRYYFDDSVVRFFESGNPDALAEAMLEVARNPHLRQRMVANALEYSARHNWQSRKLDYLNLVDSLIAGRMVHPPDTV